MYYMLDDYGGISRDNMIIQCSINYGGWNKHSQVDAIKDTKRINVLDGMSEEVKISSDSG